MASSPEYRDRLSWSTMHSASYRMFLNYCCITGTPCTYLPSQRRNPCKISLPNLWSERRLHSRSCSGSANPSLDTAAKGTFLGHDSVIVLQTATQFAGFSNTSSLYRRGIYVCTGSGIGSALSTCIQVRQHLLFYRVTLVI
jgi:hypothetical protein